MSKVEKEIHLFFIAAVIAIKACSTLVAFLALVSIKGIPISSANACINLSIRAEYRNNQASIKGDNRKANSFRALTKNRVKGTVKITHLGCLIRDSSVGGKVTLVSNKKLVYIITCITINLIQPLLHIVKAVLISRVINHLL